MRSLMLLLAATIGFGTGGVAAAQDIVVPSFPAAAMIRGENIRLRAEPAAETQVLLLLERGDEITITGAAEAADGFIFYPVEVVQTGDAGWVRELFIDPETIVPLLEPARDRAPDVAPEPDAEEEPERERPARRERRNRDAAEEPAAEEPVAQEPVVEEPAAETEPESEPEREREREAEPEPDEPAADPEPEEPADEPADEVTVTVAGEGAMATEPVALEPGRYRITATLDATEATGFTVNLLGPRDFNEPLFDEQIDSAQSLTLRTSVTIDRAGDYVIEVAEAEGVWTIEFVAR